MKIIEIKKINMNSEASYGVSLEESASSLTQGYGNWHTEGTHTYKDEF